ncbi:unnamed protein product [Cuscuta campestris]|uniref:Uncharacterized protein n=1 Tax=Cuscuta campestris TaxID=132261 RepID=A0A484LTW5_9ASTE|nr:unnamed protein product [Cuscuta campestris]
MPTKWPLTCFMGTKAPRVLFPIGRKYLATRLNYSKECGWSIHERQEKCKGYMIEYHPKQLEQTSYLTSQLNVCKGLK